MQKTSDRNSERILDFIEKNPGCYLRQIKRELAISMGSVQYQSSKLEKKGKISFTKQGLHKLHFTCGIFQDNEKNLFQFLNQEIPREIIMFIIAQSNPTQTDIVNFLGISGASVSWHIKRMVAFNIINEAREGRYKRYYLNPDNVPINSNYIARLLKNYHPSVWNKWSNRIVELFLSYSHEDKY